jgi:hypothetical protein
MNIRFLGIEVERKTDILAFAAFLLSLSSILYQIAVFFRGPQVTLAKPRQVVIYMHAAPDAKERYLTPVSTVAYVNSGQSGNNAVVLEESVSFTLEGKQHVYTWHAFVSLAFISSSAIDTSADRKIKFVQERTAAPFVVPGGGAEAHETWFAARFDEDFVGQGEIVRAFESALTGGSLIWKIRFHTETLNDGRKTAECEVTITPRFAQQIISHDIGWSVLNCK